MRTIKPKRTNNTTTKMQFAAALKAIKNGQSNLQAETSPKK